LTQTDKDSLVALVQQKGWPVEHSVRLKLNFEFFEERVTGLGSDLEGLCHGLSKLVIVDVALNRDQDNPQLIFESMNSTGRELSQADLIRNYMLMGLEPKHQTQLYEDHWRPMEVNFGQEAYGSHFDSFMRHYLTLKTGEIPNVRAVYEAFKAYSREPQVASGGVDDLVCDIQAFAGYYCAMALGKESEKVLAEAFQDLRELKVDVAYPFLLELYQDYASDLLSRNDFVKAIRLVEAYVFRRAICAIPTNSLNKTFATFRRSLKKDRYLESIQALLQLLPSYRRFPNDEEFKREFVVRDLYNFPRRSYWLRRIENWDRKERVPVDQYTIEHIMPQNENLSRQWREDLGPEWERIHETKLHTLGNLTLTGYNSEYSDRPFIEKRDMEGGFKESPLRLNEGLGATEVWDSPAIQNRANRLAAIGVKVWGAPNLSTDVLDTYKPTTEKASSYSIEDHLHLALGTTTRALFEALRKELLALDPCVTEEFLKLYIAYKAETNFVDVVPQAGRLRLALNMQFHELHDPRGVAKDVTNLGRWGNGDVEVGLTSLEDLPYVLGLIRQSFEKQMGNGESGE
jgi:predicted transport protein